MSHISDHQWVKKTFMTPCAVPKPSLRFRLKVKNHQLRRRTPWPNHETMKHHGNQPNMICIYIYVEILDVGQVSTMYIQYIIYIIHEISYYPIFIGDTSHLFVSGWSANEIPGERQRHCGTPGRQVSQGPPGRWTWGIQWHQSFNGTQPINGLINHIYIINNRDNSGFV